MLTTEQDRISAIKKSLNSYRENKSVRTETIQYRGKSKSLPVIRVTTSILLLNHDNNRLSAQLDGHPSQAKVQSDPTSQEAQNALRSLLSSTKDFKELKKQLKDGGQQEPGLVTRQGLLINGNTRLTALLELEAEGSSNGMDVAVLPEDILQKDFLDIEVRLQMANLVHQKYSFTNELLMMKRLKDADATNRELSKKMNMQVKTVAHRLRILEMIEEARNVSDPVLPWSHFDQKDLFAALDTKYETLKNAGDLQAAEAVKWSRLTALLLGISKDQVRTIDESFFQDKIIDSRLGASDEDKGLKDFLESFQPDIIADDPGGLFGEPEKKNFGDHTKALYKHFTGSDDVRDKNNGVKKDLEGNAAALHKELRLATRALISAENDRTESAKPSKVLREATIQLEGIKLKLPELSSSPDFNWTDFSLEVDKLNKVVDQINVLREKLM